jgi:hypothetical protein
MGKVSSPPERRRLREVSIGICNGKKLAFSRHRRSSRRGLGRRSGGREVVELIINSPPRLLKARYAGYTYRRCLTVGCRSESKKIRNSDD